MRRPNPKRLMDEASLAEQIARLSDAQRDELFAGLTPAEQSLMQAHWEFWSRGNQRAPDGLWRIWLVLAGRGYGKTRAGAEWVRDYARKFGGRRIALVGATMREARAIMVEGESGLLAIAHHWERPHFEPSIDRLTWPNGSLATLYSAAEPENLHGASHHIAWADEIAKWKAGMAAWDNLMLGLRLGDYPRAVATTTPRPVPLIKRLLEDPSVMVTRGRTLDNRLILGRGFVAAMDNAYGGTRLGRQELDGELITDIAGSLWPRALIEACRVDDRPALVRVVVAVDPPVGAKPDSDACGIIVAGLGADDQGYVLDDASVQGAGPDRWAATVAAAARDWSADRVIAEANQGGAMVRSVLKAVERNLPLTLVHATRGKVARAEPVAALYERRRVHHVGAFPQLEDELAGLIIGGGYAGPGRSPDRADALVYALTELMLNRAAGPTVRRL